MPKKRQITFQTSIPGKFIPRNTPPPGSAFSSKATDNRFNAKMAELLASSSTVNDENELFSARSPQDNAVSNEIVSADSSNIHSRLFHRRIVTVIESINKTTVDPPALPSAVFQSQYKSQPITFGQLRRATISPVSAQVFEDKSVPQKQGDTDEKQDKILTLPLKDNDSNLILTTSESLAKRSTNKERPFHSSSSVQRLGERNAVLQTTTDDNQVQSALLTVDEILAMYYSKVKLSTEIESKLSTSNDLTTSNISTHYGQSSVSNGSSNQTHEHIVHPSTISSEHNRNRPPPPSYASSISSSSRTTLTVISSFQQSTRAAASSLPFEQTFSDAPVSSHLFIGNQSSIFPNSSSTFGSTVIAQQSNSSMRPPPPRYQSPNSTSERSPSTFPPATDISTPSQPTKSTVNTTYSSTGFDHEFSRLLYGKDARKTRRYKNKRKAFSDPVKTSVAEAGQLVEKSRRCVTSHLNTTVTVPEEEKEEDEEKQDENDDTIRAERRRSEARQQESSFRSRRIQRQLNLIETKRELLKGALMSRNFSVKQRIPSFLRIYSQAPSSNDVLLQWHLFNLSELEAFDAMMSRLYKNENLARVQFYETYRTVLLSVLTAKKLSKTNIENASIISAV